MESQWTLQDAKNKFSDVVNAACEGSPQFVTKRGVPSVVVLSLPAYKRLMEQCKVATPGFADFLLSMPAPDVGDLTASQSELALREVDF